MASIQESVQGYRTTQVQVNGHQGLLSKLKIGNNIYDIKDPAVEQLATFVDNAIEGVQTQITRASNSWTPVTKGENAGKFATSVTQGAQGGITVAYSNIRDAALTNSAANNKIITSLTQDVDGQVSYSVEDLVASNVKSNAVTADNTHIGVQGGSVQDAITDLAKGVQSAKADAITAAQEKINELAGTNWTKAAGTVKDIIDELSGADTTATQAMITVADKLRGDFAYGEAGSQTSNVQDYIDAKDAAILAQVKSVSVTATGDTLVSASVDNSGRAIIVGAQTALSDAVGYAKSALQTVTGESGNTALVSVSEKTGNDGAKTSAVSATTKLSNAVGYAETSLQTVTGETDANALIQVGGKTGEVGAQTTAISATQKLKKAVTAAEGSLAAAKVTKDNVAYCTSSTYTSDSEQLELTFATKDFVIPTSNWPNS